MEYQVSSYSARGLFSSCRFEKVLSQRRENINKHYLFIEHSRAMPAAGWKVQHVARLGNSLLITNDEAHTSTLDDSYLFVRMLVSRRVHMRLEAQAANHQLRSDDHLSLDTFTDALDGYAVPTAVLRSDIQD
jgi:hypothetical protein